MEVTVQLLLGLDFLNFWAVVLIGCDGDGEAAQSCRGGDEDQGHFLLPSLFGFENFSLRCDLKMGVLSPFYSAFPHTIEFFLYFSDLPAIFLPQTPQHARQLSGGSGQFNLYSRCNPDYVPAYEPLPPLVSGPE